MRKDKRLVLGLIGILAVTIVCVITHLIRSTYYTGEEFAKRCERPYEANGGSIEGIKDPFFKRLVEAAKGRTLKNIRYDPMYFKIDYPGGDIPQDLGVCTDLIIRAYRKVGIDLQKEVHEDMKDNFSLYPKIWGLRRPDPNIDHRRVPNLMVFFKRKGKTLPITNDPCDYHPGDVVVWDLGGGITHIGIVVDKKGDECRYKVVHNIGYGPKIEDVLFNWKIIGHYRYPAFENFKGNRGGNR
jgi:hypothetical protein